MTYTRCYYIVTYNTFNTCCPGCIPYSCMNNIPLHICIHRYNTFPRRLLQKKEVCNVYTFPYVTQVRIPCAQQNKTINISHRMEYFPLYINSSGTRKTLQDLISVHAVMHIPCTPICFCFVHVWFYVYNNPLERCFFWNTVSNTTPTMYTHFYRKKKTIASRRIILLYTTRGVVLTLPTMFL